MFIRFDGVYKHMIDDLKANSEIPFQFLGVCMYVCMYVSTSLNLILKYQVVQLLGMCFI